MVSEFMLQQTRIETVFPYYERFLKVFPSLPHLAQAPLQRVLQLWAGMGYYARARNLRAAAKIIVKDLGGKIPSTKEALLALPGFGPYTAGAVASIAFNQRAAALDGNVKRVLSRLSGVSDSVFPLSKKRRLENFAGDLVPEGYASEFNQGLMDLGATICLPARPKCPSCPIKRFCSFSGAEKSAGKRQQRNRREEVWAVALIESKGRFLIHRKDDRGLLSGLWQFPTIVTTGKAVLPPGKNGGSAREVLRKSLRDIFGIKIIFRKTLPPLQHSFTHIQATLIPYLFSLDKDQNVPQAIRRPVARWVELSGLSRYPVSRAMAKVSNLLKNSLNGIPVGKRVLSEGGRGEK
jgi:A/G-specific adenine glycosylase